jgi:cation diffusion facilitator family transporter
MPGVSKPRTRDDRPAWAGLAGNLLLAALKVGVGLLGRSQALLADGIHSAADALGSVAVLVGLRVARQPADAGHPYGHGKAESLASLVVAALLGLAGAEVAVSSALALLRPHAGPSPDLATLWVAIVSVAVKEGLYRYGRALGLRQRSPALLSSAEDHRSDALSSLAAVGGILGARLGVPLLDPAAAFFVSLLIMRVGWRLGLGAIQDLIDARGEPRTLARLSAEARAYPGVAAVQQVRTRRMGRDLLVDMEIGVDGGRTLREAHAVADGVRNRLVRRVPEVADVMVHVNPVGEGDGKPAGGGAGHGLNGAAEDALGVSSRPGRRDDDGG